MAFKMNYNKDTFPYKDMGPTKHDDAHMTKTIAKDKKPDFLDLDGDGNKNESMEDAASNKNKKRPEDEDNFMRQEDDTREDIEDTAPYGLDE
mgnify:CR=1 FL=1